jgi:hypothetical protein
MTLHINFSHAQIQFKDTTYIYIKALKKMSRYIDGFILFNSISMNVQRMSKSNLF